MAISKAHERARAFGLDGLRSLVNHVRANVSDQSTAKQQAAAPPPPSVDAAHTNYAQSLLARFALPSARANFAASLASPSSFLSAALQQAAGGPRSDIEQHGSAMPSLAGLLEQVAALQQEKSELTRQLQQERGGGGLQARSASSSTQWSGMKSVGSDSDFDTISHEDVSAIKDASGGSWGAWMRGGGKRKAGSLPMGGAMPDQDVASSSGVSLKH